MNLETRKIDSSKLESFFAVFILMGGMASAMAEPPPPESKDAERAVRMEQRMERLNLRQAESKMQEERRRATLSNLMDGRNEPGKRSRLTPDERRDLRRHINQAGQDIYNAMPTPPND